MPNFFIQKLTDGKGILQRLTKRFALTDAPVLTKELLLNFKKEVQPISNIDELLKENKIEAASGVAIAATGWYTVLTVPAGKRWYIFGIEVEKAGGNITTIDSIGVSDGTNVVGWTDFTPATAVNAGLVGGMPVEEGWTIKAYFTCAGAGTANAYALIQEEDAY